MLLTNMRTNMKYERKTLLRGLTLLIIINLSPMNLRQITILTPSHDQKYSQVGMAAVHALVPHSSYTLLSQQQCMQHACPIYNDIVTTLSSTSGDANEPHPEMAFERGVAGGGSGTSSFPVRTKKHQNRKNKTKVRKAKARRPSPSGPLNEREMAHHVASQYVNGPKGLVRMAQLRWDKVEPSSSSSEHDKGRIKDHLDYVKILDRHPALVLNADYQPLTCLPLSLWSWQEAMKAVFSGKVTVVDVYPGIYVRAASLSTPLPSVIALNDYTPQHQKVCSNVFVFILVNEDMQLIKIFKWRLLPNQFSLLLFLNDSHLPYHEDTCIHTEKCLSS
mmetsp:Transcript_34047/g.45499  ORF Transcript_34047/g.45499 Transcript_34047/m.45499 type:complete len:333 (+) Transcript_34047:1847-2845(+)